MKKITALCIFTAALATSQPANAGTITLGLLGGGGVFTDTSYIIGEIFQTNDIRGGQADRDAAALNKLLAVALGTRSGTSGSEDPELYRTTNVFSPLPPATAIGANGGPSSFSGSGPIQIASHAFTYLVVSYDGPNGGSTAYHIGGIAAGDTIEFARKAEPSGSGTPDWGHLYSSNKYDITHWTMLNPTGGGTGGSTGSTVPDGGMTMSLLGLGLAGMGLMTRLWK